MRMRTTTMLIAAAAVVFGTSGAWASTMTGTVGDAMCGVTHMVNSGTINGTSGTYTLTMPAGSMMMQGCTATATGFVDMDDLMDQIHGVYSGSNTCAGPFDHGQISLTHHG